MSKNTLNTISELTGVSVSTVSRVLSGQAEKYRISPVTAGKIREAAEQSGYIPDLVAKGLRTRRTGTTASARCQITHGSGWSALSRTASWQ